MNEGRQRFTTYVSPGVLGRARGAVEGLRKQGQQITLADISEHALLSYIEDLESRHNHGVPWPDPGPIRGGRPRHS